MHDETDPARLAAILRRMDKAGSTKKGKTHPRSVMVMSPEDRAIHDQEIRTEMERQAQP